MELVQVAVADAAVRDLYLDVLLADRAAHESERRQVACMLQQRIDTTSTQELQGSVLLSGLTQSAWVKLPRCTRAASGSSTARGSAN